MSNKKTYFHVLIACEESQAVSSEIRRAAKRYNLPIKAFSCDLLPTSAKEDSRELTGKEYHLQGDALKLMSFDANFDYIDEFCKKGTTLPKTLSYVIKNVLIEDDGGWDLIIAHPPCTFFTVSGNRWFVHPKDKTKDFHPLHPYRKIERAEAARFLLSLALAPCKYKVLENPIGMIKRVMEEALYNVGTLPRGVSPSDVPEGYRTPKYTTPVTLKGLKVLYPKQCSKLSAYKLPKWEELKTLGCEWLVERPLELAEVNTEGAKVTYPIKVQPYYFGDCFSKTTCFWTKGFEKPLEISNLVDRGEFLVAKSGNRIAKWYSDALKLAKTPLERRTLRSKTFPGIARALTYQWVLWAASKEGVISKEAYSEILARYYAEA